MILRQVVQRPVTPLATRLSNSCTKSTAWHVAFHCLAALTRPAKCSLHCPGCYGIHQDPWFEIMCGWCFQMLPARHGDFPAILGHTWFIVTSKKLQNSASIYLSIYLSIYRSIYFLLYYIHFMSPGFSLFFWLGGLAINTSRSTAGAAWKRAWPVTVRPRAVFGRTPLHWGLGCHWGCGAKGGMKNMGMPRVKIVDIWVWYFP